MKHFVAYILISSVSLHSWAQSPQQQQQLDRFKDRSREQEASLENDPFIGVTTNGTVKPDLFKIKSTGVSTKPIRIAADNFISTLTKAQRQKTLFPVDDNEWRHWMNQHFYDRAGIGFEGMNEDQRKAAFSLLESSLSEEGFQLARDIMKLNHTLGEMQGDMFLLGECAYWITIMGTPSSTEPWGWQIDGHHLIINFFVLGDQVVATPTFVGSEPVTTDSGKYAGIEILQDEQNQALSFAQSLTPNQRSRAVISEDKPGNDNQTEAFKDNVVLPYEGINVTELNRTQTTDLKALVALFIGNMKEGHANVRMEEILLHWNETYFAWKGTTDDDAVFYYRIHSPVVLIEFDHQNPVGLRRQFPNRSPIRQHVHAVIRTPNGNDYGKDLLRQHRERHHH